MDLPLRLPRDARRLAGDHGSNGSNGSNGSDGSEGSDGGAGGANSSGVDGVPRVRAVRQEYIEAQTWPGAFFQNFPFGLSIAFQARRPPRCQDVQWRVAYL